MSLNARALAHISTVAHRAFRRLAGIVGSMTFDGTGLCLKHIRTGYRLNEAAPNYFPVS